MNLFFFSSSSFSIKVIEHFLLNSQAGREPSTQMVYSIHNLLAHLSNYFMSALAKCSYNCSFYTCADLFFFSVVHITQILAGQFCVSKQWANKNSSGF